MANVSIGNLYASLSLKSEKLKSGAIEAEGVMRKLEKDIDDIKDAINNKLAMIGATLSAGVTLPLTLMGKSALDTFSQFEQAMQNTFSVMGATASEMEMLRKKAEGMGAATRFSASQAAGALYSLGSAGQSATEAAASLDGVLSLAGATGSDLAFTSETITSTLSQFNMEASKASHIADVYAKAISKSQANMTKLSYSMRYVGPVASGLGISLETATAALMRLYNTGYGGEMAGNYLKNGLQRLASGGEDFKAKLDAIGLSYDEVNPKTNNLADIIERLREKQVDVTKANELFGDAAGGAMLKLIEGGGEAIRTMDGLLQSSHGTAEEMQKMQNTSFANTKDELSSAFEAVQITLTSNVIPAVDMVAKAFTKVLQFVNELPVGVQVAGTGLATMAAAAGPLLLVALSVKKIKAEMAALNVTMMSNPIFLIGTAIAAGTALALGAIAQIRKANDDYIHSAKRSIDDIRKMQDNALAEGNKGRKINSLLDEYETLKNKTTRTADEQARYNQLLAELQELVPDVVTKLNAQGEAFIENAEKAREAARQQLETEKALNDMALVTTRAKAEHAEAVIAKYKNKPKELQAQLKIETENVKAATLLYQQIQAKYEEFKHLQEAGRETAAAKIREEIQHLYLSNNGVQAEGGVWDYGNVKKMVKAFEKHLNTVTGKQQKTLRLYESIKNAVEENIAAKKELLDLEARSLAIAKAQGELSEEASKKETAKTRQQHADTSWDEYETRKKRWEKEKKEAVFLGREFDEVGKKIEFLQAEISNLLHLNAADVADGVFALNSKELKKLKEELDTLLKLQGKNKKNGSGGEKSKDLQAHIDELDSYYRKRISMAKEYGLNEAKETEKWLKERKALLDKYDNEKELRKKEAGGSGITVGDEKKRTEFLGYADFTKYLNEQKELQKELDKTRENIEKTKALLASKGQDLTPNERRAAKDYLEDLQEKANKLEIELKQSQFTLAEIDKTLEAIENCNKSDFELKLINIEKEKERLLQVIDEAKKAGKISEEEAEKAKKKVQEKIKKDKQDESVKNADPYVKGAIGIANAIADVIADAIEKGGVDGLTAIAAAGEIIGQIGDMVRNSVAKAVLGATSAVVGITTKIMGAIRRKNAAYSAEQREKMKNFNQKVQEGIEKNIRRASEIAGDVPKTLAKAFSGKKLSIDSIFDSQSVELQKKKIDSFLDTVKDLKTEYQEGVTKQKTVKKYSKWDPLHWFGWEETENYTEYTNFTVAQVLEQYQAAMDKGDYQAAMGWRNFATKAIKKGLADAGLAGKDIDPITNYLGSLDGALAEYVKHRDMKSFKKALETQLYNALANKAVTNVMSGRIGQIFAQVEKGTITYEEGLKKIEGIGDEAAKIFDEMNERFGLTAEKAKTEWEKVGDAIASSLTQALGDAAYNADWGSFKKAFANEMKKTIIQSSLESAGVKAKVEAIINSLMEDGKITSEEINKGIRELQPIYDNMEKVMAEVAKATKALEGGVEIQTHNSGTIFQQLSGADRDFLSEIFNEGLSKVKQTFDFDTFNVQQLQATQLIINSMTFNSYNGVVNITATESTDLRAVLTEIVEEALAG